MIRQAESHAIEKITARLTPEEHTLRLALMERIISTGGPVAINNFDDQTDLHGIDLAGICSRLIDKQVLVLDEQQQVQSAYPVSALPTHHRVHLADGRSFSAMCGIDAIGSAFTFEQDIAITSHCSRCSAPVELKLRDGQIETLKPAETHVLHVDLNKFGDWSGNC